MKKIKIIISISLFATILTACGTVKDGFKNQKKDSRDEFLVEKKAPLVMPPEFNELPLPSNDTIEDNEKDDVKKLITISANSNPDSENSENTSSNLEESILEKIKK